MHVAAIARMHTSLVIVLSGTAGETRLHGNCCGRRREEKKKNIKETWEVKDTFVRRRMRAHVRIKVEELELRDEEAVCLKKEEKKKQQFYYADKEAIEEEQTGCVCRQHRLSRDGGVLLYRCHRKTRMIHTLFGQNQNINWKMLLFTVFISVLPIFQLI